MKSKLTPFDGELLVMIADIMKVEPTVEESATTYTISVPIGDNTPDTVTAMQNAVRGRLGKRLIMLNDVDNCKEYYVAYVDDAESMADEIRTEYDAPDDDDVCNYPACTLRRAMEAKGAARLEGKREYRKPQAFDVPKEVAGVAELIAELFPGAKIELHRIDVPRNNPRNRRRNKNKRKGGQNNG